MIFLTKNPKKAGTFCKLYFQLIKGLNRLIITKFRRILYINKITRT